MLIECQWSGCVTANIKSSMGPSLLIGLLDVYPSCSNTPDPYANAYRMGASNRATMASSSARVESATGRIWFRPKEGGRCESTWPLWGTAGRGAGFKREREAGLFAAEGGGGGGGCGPEEAAVSVDRERMTRVGSLRALVRASIVAMEGETRDRVVGDRGLEKCDDGGLSASEARRSSTGAPCLGLGAFQTRYSCHGTSPRVSSSSCRPTPPCGFGNTFRSTSSAGSAHPRFQGAFTTCLTFRSSGSCYVDYSTYILQAEAYYYICQVHSLFLHLLGFCPCKFNAPDQAGVPRLRASTA